MDEALVEPVRSAVEEFVNVNAVPGTPKGPVGQRQVMQRLWAALPDARFEVEEVAADGRTVILVGTMSGTHRGEISGIPATGKAVSWRQCHLLTVDEQGRFVEHDAIRDDLGLLRQLGVMPGAEAAS